MGINGKGITPFTDEKVNTALQEVKNRKAPGYDGIKH